MILPWPINSSRSFYGTRFLTYQYKCKYINFRFPSSFVILLLFKKSLLCASSTSLYRPHFTIKNCNLPYSFAHNTYTYGFVPDYSVDISSEETMSYQNLHKIVNSVHLTLPSELVLSQTHFVNMYCVSIVALRVFLLLPSFTSIGDALQGLNRNCHIFYTIDIIVYHVLQNSHKSFSKHTTKKNIKSRET